MSDSYRTVCCLALCLAAAFAVTPAQDPNACDEPGDYPDLIAGDLHSIARMGSVDGITAYAIGATTCNLGTCWVNWFFDTGEHPVFGQNLFRLKNGRFEQIGQSWVAHRFFALSQIYCDEGCQPTNGQHLGVDCSTTNSAPITAQQPYLGPKSEVDASTGSFAFPFGDHGVTGDAIYKRLQVHDEDLDPVLNAGALYFIEGQQVAADDGAAGMIANNASHRAVEVLPDLDLAPVGPTVQQLPAIHAWAALDPDVLLETVDVEDDGRFLVASKATALGGGMWHYEYAVHNLSSHRSAGSVTVALPSGAVVANAGFHDVDYHSGEPIDGTDWAATVETGTVPSVRWATDAYDVNPDANALRWGTLYNFRFDADAPPIAGELEVGLFRPGTPDAFSVGAVVPRVCDDDATCEPGENACNCAADCGAPAESELVCADGLDDDCDGATDCADGDCCGVGGCPAVDGDGDSLLACEDCNDNDGAVWATPGLVTGVLVSKGPLDRAILEWNPPAEPGAVSIAYETIRSPEASDFVTGAVCLPVTNPEATTSTDGEDPAAGGVFHYLVRATNDCPIGTGPLGSGSDGSSRPAIVCP